MIKLEVIEGVVEDLVVVDADVNYLANAEENSQTAEFSLFPRFFSQTPT